MSAEAATTMQFNTILIITLLVALATGQMIEFDASLNNTIYIDRSQKHVALNVVGTGGIYGNVRVIYSTTSNKDIIPFYNSTGILTFDGDSVQSIRLIMINDTLELEDYCIVKIHVSGSGRATLGKRNAIRLVGHKRNIFKFKSISPLDAGISKPQWVRKHKVQKIQSNSKMSDKSFPSRINLIKKRTISDPFADYEYFVGFIPNFGSYPAITLLTSSENPVTYSIEAPMTGFHQTGTITLYVQDTLNLPLVLSGPSFNFPNGVNNASKEGIHIQSGENQLLVIGSMGSHNFDTFLGIPTIKLCLHEYVYFGISVATGVLSDGSVVIVGTANETMITLAVSVSANIRINNSANWTSIYPGIVYSYEIQKQQIIYIAALTTDLTGTKVTSNKPISLFSGHECAFIPYETRSCDPLIEQIPPTYMWSTVHFLAPVSTRISYIVKIVAAYDSTTIKIYCNNTINTYIINAGEYMTVTYNNQQYCGVYASRQVLVAQLSHSYNSDMNGHAMMTLIPATTHYTNKIVSSTLQSSDPSVRPTHFINVIVLADYYQPELISITSAKGLIQSLSSQNWVPIKRNGIIKAYAAQVNITNLVNLTHSVFEITHFNKTALMTFTVYGFETPRAYGHPGWIKNKLNVDFTLEQYITMESVGFAEIKLKLSGGILPVPISVTINSINQSALSTMGEKDYAHGKINVTLPAGAISQTIRINVTDDNILECNEMFSVMIESVSDCGITIGNANISEVVIIEDHDGVLSLEHSNYTVDDRIDVLSVTILLSSVASKDVIVVVTITDGTATAGIDYNVTASVFNVTISAGAASSSFNIDIIDDVIHESHESFDIAIRMLPNCLSLSLGISFSTVTIIDDDIISICFEESFIHIYEDQGMITSTITLTNYSSTDITVMLITNDATARGGDDYELGSFGVTIPAGETSVSFNISIIDDNIFEGNESFSLTIDSSSLPSRVLLQESCVVVITIVNDDVISVRFSSATYTIDENNGILRPLLFLNHSSPFVETVYVMTTDISAEGGGIDYISGPFTVIFPVGSTQASFEIVINFNDNILENDEKFNISVTSITNDHIKSIPGVATVTIIDTTTTSICFSESTVSINENEGSVMYSVSLTNPSSGGVMITVITTDGTATGGNDYLSGPFNVTILAGRTSTNFNISILDDNIFETDESLSLTMDSSSLPSRIMIQSDCLLIIAIVDNDAITVQFSNAKYTVNEDAGIMQPQLILSNPSSFVETVQMITTNVTAYGKGIDYNSGSYTVVFPIGSTNASVDIMIYDDDLLEEDEDLNISITSITNRHIVGTPGVATVTITDTTTSEICFNNSLVSIIENQGLLVHPLNLTNPSSAAIIITIATMDGTATGNEDYKHGPFNVTIPTGETSVLLNISIIDDNVFEGNESFSITIDSFSLPSRVLLQPDCMLMVMVVDNDAITVTFDKATYTVNEDTGTVKPLLILSNPSSFIETVQVITTDITTNGNSDYSPGPYFVFFPVQTTNSSLVIALNDDSLSEPNEEFNISITSFANDFVVGTPRVATVTIIDVETTDNTNPTAAVISGVVGTSLIVVILVLVGLCIVRVWKNCKKRNNDSCVREIQMTVIGNSSNANPVTAEVISLLRKELGSYLVDFNVLTIGDEISSGNFGVVHKALYINDNSSTEIAIKILKDISFPNTQQFINECIIMKELDHPNILRLIGIAISPIDGALNMIMPFMHYGDIRSFLQNKRGNKMKLEDFPKDLSCYILLKMCLEIAKGMEYLSSQRFVHRDLAARNCMLDEKFTAKVADFGLSRDVYVSGFYAANTSTARPMKWLAPEAIFDQKYTEKSDVWAFGVTFWEIFSFGIQPYPSVHSNQISEHIERGEKLQQPTLSPIEIYAIMRNCWGFKPEDRPSFADLVKDISQQLEVQRQVKQLQEYPSTSYLKLHN